MISFAYTGGAMIIFRTDRVNDLNATERMVMISLCSYADNTGRCWPSHNEIARTSGASVASVKRCLSKLSKLGYIEVSNRGDGKGRITTNMYQINIEKSVPVQRTDKVVPMRGHQTTEEKLFDRTWDIDFAGHQ